MKKITKLLLYYFFFLFKVLRVYTLYKNDVLYLIIFTGIKKHMNFTLFSFILIIVWWCEVGGNLSSPPKRCYFLLSILLGWGMTVALSQLLRYFPDVSLSHVMHCHSSVFGHGEPRVPYPAHSWEDPKWSCVISLAWGTRPAGSLGQLSGSAGVILGHGKIRHGLSWGLSGATNHPFEKWEKAAPHDLWCQIYLFIYLILSTTLCWTDKNGLIVTRLGCFCVV